MFPLAEDSGGICPIPIFIALAMQRHILQCPLLCENNQSYTNKTDELQLAMDTIPIIVFKSKIQNGEAAVTL